MTERFTLGVGEKGLGITDNVTGEQYLENDDTTLIRLNGELNALHEENEQAKHEIETYKAGNRTLKEIISELKEENCILQHELRKEQYR